MIPVALTLLALLDAAFCGFRAAAGRNALIAKRGYYARAIGIGALAGAGLVTLLAATTLALYFSTSDSPAFYAELLIIGARLLWPFGIYAALVLVALVVYGTTRAEIQTFATVAILGPFTLVRPWLVVFATAFGVSAPVGLRARALTVLSSAGVLLLGKLLDIAYGRVADARIGALLR